MYKSVTGIDLVYECFGKPNPEVYALAEASLRAQADVLGWDSWGTRSSDTIVAEGDIASVDIQDANQAGWESSLVLRGVAQAGDVLEARDCPVRPTMLEVVSDIFKT